ncbi:MAG: amino acid ABC transporter permease [Actinomycetes bacterium]
MSFELHASAAYLASASYVWDWGSVFNKDIGHLALIGLKYTLEVCGLSFLIGSTIGMAVAGLRLSHTPPFTQIAYIYTDFFRTTPALVQLIWVFYVVPVLFGIVLSPLVSGVVALSLNAGAFFAEVFRGGIESIPRGQWDAAYVLGYRRRSTLARIILPQGLRQALPATANIFISLLKDSSLLSVIAVHEITYQAQTQAAQNFRPLELYTALAVAYFLLTYPLSLTSSWLEKRFRVH